MYHVQGTLIAVSLLYLISYSFYLLGFLTLVHHRKIWNTILAVSFLFTALAGIFMALQINYKWDIPFVKVLLKWHVEVGILFGASGIYHFIWHLSYFRKIFRDSPFPSGSENFPFTDPGTIRLNLFIVGFSSTAVQLTLIREMMNISGGYELIAGIFLGSWLIASSAGAAAAGRSPVKNIGRINLIFSISPLITLGLLIFIKRIFLNTGQTPSVLESFIMTIAVLVPFCLVSGFTFVKLIACSRNLDSTDPGRSFSTETAGGIAAGIFISLVAQGRINDFRLLLLVVILSSAFTINAFYIKKNRTGIIVNLIITGFVLLIFLFDPDIFFRQILLGGVKVEATIDTHYGNLTTGIYGGEKSVYYNHRLLSYSGDAIEREEDIHYALLQRADYKSVILISGALKSHLPEIEKYGVKKIICLEQDPELIKNAVSEIPDLPARVMIEKDDAFRYFKEKGETTDAVIMLLPPPSTLSLNRYYTTEFFSGIKNRLNQGGIFACSPGPGDNYLNRESVDLYSSVYNSLAAIFRYVTPVAGSKLYFIASDEKISTGFCKLTAERKIINSYVGPDYLSDDLIAAKSDQVIVSLDKNVKLNHTTFPVACFYFQSYTFSKDLGEKVPVMLLMLAAFVLPSIVIRREHILMYYTASALAGFEIIILLTLQLTAGNMYQLTGMVISALMAGLAVGSGLTTRFTGKSKTKQAGMVLILYFVLFALVTGRITGMKSTVLATALIVLSTIIPAFITGYIFREFTLPGKRDETTSMVYSADLSGSAFGFILLSVLLIPAVGLSWSVFSLSLLVLTGIVVGTKGNK